MRNFIVYAALAVLGMSSALPCMAVNSEHSPQVVNAGDQRGGYVFMGNLYPVSVEKSGTTLIVTVPAPSQTVLGTAPSCPWSINGSGQLVIRIPEHVGVGGYMEVGVRLSNGDTGVYYVILD